MATEFICTLKSSGGDFTTMSGWDSACACDLTASGTKVFSISSETGTLSDGTSVTADSGGTATVVHVNTAQDQVLLKSISGTINSGDDVVDDGDAGNYVTLSDAGNDAAAVLECYAFTSDLNDRVDIASPWVTNATGNTVIIRAAAGEEATMDDSSGFRIYYSVLNSGVITLTVANVEIRHISIDDVRDFGTSGSAIRAQSLAGTRVHACVGKVNKASLSFRAFDIYSPDLSTASLTTASFAKGTGVGFYCNNYQNHKVENSVAADMTYGFAHQGTAGVEGLNAVNCAAYNNSTANYYGDGYFYNSSHNASDDYSGDPPPGSNPYTSDLAASDFDTVTAGSEDFHLGTSGNLDDAGTTGSYAFDFDDDAITTWPIGLDAAAGSGSPYTLTAAGGSYTLSGVAAALQWDRYLSAAAGSYVLSGVTAALQWDRILNAANGSYTLTGQDATLTYTPAGGSPYTLTASAGSFALSGVAATLLWDRIVVAAAGSYTLTGQAAGLKQGYVVSADTGSYALTGQDVTLTYSGPAKLSAEAGSYALTGFAATLTWTRATGWREVSTASTNWTEVTTTSTNWTEV